MDGRKVRRREDPDLLAEEVFDGHDGSIAGASEFAELVDGNVVQVGVTRWAVAVPSVTTHGKCPLPYDMLGKWRTPNCVYLAYANQRVLRLSKCRNSEYGNEPVFVQTTDIQELAKYVDCSRSTPPDASREEAGDG